MTISVLTVNNPYWIVCWMFILCIITLVDYFVFASHVKKYPLNVYEEYKEANGINVFVDGSTDQRQEKRYLSIEFYLYSIETEQYEKVTLSNFEYMGGTPHSYYSQAYLKVDDKIYVDDYATFNFHHIGNDKAHALFPFIEQGTSTEITFSSDFKLE